MSARRKKSVATFMVHPQLMRLASRIHAGEIIFFVGAGFSTDTEKPDANWRTKRVLLRLYALEDVAANTTPPLGRHATLHLVGTFANCFGGTPPIGSDLKPYTKAVLERFSQRYYELHEWICDHYTNLFWHLVGSIDSAAKARETSERLSATEKALAADVQWNETFAAIPSDWWLRARKILRKGSEQQHRSWGKFLFLETMGFLDRTLVEGISPPLPSSGNRLEEWDDLSDVAHCHEKLLLPRHHVLARLAREGLCPTLLTTNFDLQLEGALRLSGFRWPNETPALAPSSLPHFDVIASPEAFFDRGKAYRTATLVKLHGCVNELRQRGRRKIAIGSTLGPKDIENYSADPQSAQEYSSQVIYTFREIQNWRDDSWAADYVRTLLRTRAFVFCGYSISDQVLHDTMRGVYEEMARKRGVGKSPVCNPAHAPAYFLAYSAHDAVPQRYEFHGCQILHAAGAAVGGRHKPKADDHPNYLRFHPLNQSRLQGWQKPNGHPGAQLTIDEVLSWTHHLVLRMQQRKALRTELVALASQMLGRVPADEFKTIFTAFDRRLRQEMNALHVTPRARRRSEDARHAFRAALNWTTGFHRSLLREWASAQALQRAGRPTRATQAIRQPLWYFPASECPAWTAWGAVLELALIELGERALDQPRPKAAGSLPIVFGTQTARPTVLLRRRAEAHAPLLALTLQVRGFAAPGARPHVPGHPARHVIWHLAGDDLPWKRTRDNALPKPFRAEREHTIAAPAARVIWDLARGESTRPAAIQDPAQARRQIIEPLLGSWTRNV